jgi:endonuclease YncB( thermonuclease family)
MKLFCALFFLFCFAARADEGFPAAIDYVLDGDTFSARTRLDGGSAVMVRVRIRNIDAPELHGECESETKLANLAKRRLSELLPAGTEVRLTKIKDDKYLGRIDALASLGGRDVGEIMVAEKLARRYNGGRRLGWCE